MDFHIRTLYLIISSKTLSCDVLRSSMCQMIVHCQPFIFLLANCLARITIPLWCWIIASRTVALPEESHKGSFLVSNIALVCHFCSSIYIFYIILALV